MLRRALCAALGAALCAAPAAHARWSAPARPVGCSAALVAPRATAPAALTTPATPLVVFPSVGPQTRSGPGALLWTAPPGCGAGGGGALEESGATGASEVVGATLGADDLPGLARPLSRAAARGLAATTVAVGTAAGEVVVAGSSSAAVEESVVGAFAEGRTVGRFTPARPLGGPVAPVAVAGAYLGDVVLASPTRTRRGGWEIAVREQRHYGSSFDPPRLVPAGPGPPSAVAAAMDYRAEILLVWAARGAVYARELPAGGAAGPGAAGPVRRLGSAGAVPEIGGALLSDDGHAIVAWRSLSAAPTGGTRTTIELSRFETGPGSTLSPGSLRRVERFSDPPGLPPPAGSLRLIRLSSEAVMMAWTGLSAGRYVVRASPVSLRRGAWAPVVISGAGGTTASGTASGTATGTSSGTTSSGTTASGTTSSGTTPASSTVVAAGGDAVLADLIPGPHAEALALWSAAPRRLSGGLGRAGPGPWALLAARGHYAGHGEVAFEAPETVAPPGPNGPPAAALDPQTGQALAAWVVFTGGSARSGGGRIAYALRAAGPAAAPPPTAARTAAQARAATAPSPLALALAVLALLLLLAAATFLRGVLRRPGHMRARRG